MITEKPYSNDKAICYLYVVFLIPILNRKILINKIYNMEVTWNNCTGDVWCDFNSLNLTHEHFNNMVGVYIIWSNRIVVRVGSGIIKDRIADHRNNNNITRYPNLKVTWASVSETYMQRVEAYLGNTLNPTVGERFPDVPPIQVNLPW